MQLTRQECGGCGSAKAESFRGQIYPQSPAHIHGAVPVGDAGPVGWPLKITQKRQKTAFLPFSPVNCRFLDRKALASVRKALASVRKAFASVREKGLSEREKGLS